MRPLTTLALITTTLTSGCYGDWPGGGGSSASPQTFEAETLTYDDGSTVEVCSFEVFAWTLTSEVYSVCLEGSTDAANPEIPTVTFLSPDCWYGEELPLPSPDHALEETNRDPAHPTYAIQSAGAPICQANEAAGTWKAVFVPPTGVACEEYEADGLSFFVPGDNGVMEWSNPYVTCPYSVVVYSSFVPPFPDGSLGVGEGSCVPGQAEFQLAARKDLGEVGSNQVAHQVAALATTPVHLNETASIRAIEVLDLGGHDAIHIAPPRTELATDSNGFVGGFDLTQVGAKQKFASRALPMSTAFGVLTDTGVSADAPRVRMSWTCDGMPQTTPLSVGTTFRWTPPSSFPVAHPLTVGVDAQENRLWIAPEGRAVDAMALRTRPVAGGLAFEGLLSAYGATVRGRVVQTGSGAQIQDLVIRYGDQDEIVVGTQNLASY